MSPSLHWRTLRHHSGISSDRQFGISRTYVALSLVILARGVKANALEKTIGYSRIFQRAVSTMKRKPQRPQDLRKSSRSLAKWDKRRPGRKRMRSTVLAKGKRIEIAGVRRFHKIRIDSPAYVGRRRGADLDRFATPSNFDGNQDRNAEFSHFHPPRSSSAGG
jgi:hypothetical protein